MASSPHVSALLSLNGLLLWFALGLLTASYLPQLPGLASLGVYVLLGLPAALLGYWQRRRCGGQYSLAALCYGLALLLGLAWGVGAGQRLLAQQLPHALEGETLWLEGWVEAIPQRDSDKARWVLRLASPLAVAGPERVQLSWYRHAGRGGETLPLAPSVVDAADHTSGTQRAEAPVARGLPVIEPGQFWRFQVRLKRPRGFVNPSGFDYQAWLLRRGLGATGYVLAGEQREPPGWMPLQSRIDRWRWQLQQWVVKSSQSNQRGILVALLIGDSQLVERPQWQLVQQTGISHLIAISGLHVGFLAIVGYCLGLGLGRLLQPALAWWKGGRRSSWALPAQRLAHLSAVACALGYSALAGFNIPTVRTLIMLAVFYLAAFCYRRARLSHNYMVALVLVLMIQPLAGFDIGFWLSFTAVGLLILVFSGRRERRLPGAGQTALARAKARRWLVDYGRSQWVMFIGLLVPLALLINATPLLSPLANLVAIPLITFAVVPCLLLGAALSPLSDTLASWLLQLAAWLVEALMHWLASLVEVVDGWHHPVLAFSMAQAALLLLAGALLLLPKGLLPRAWGYSGLALGALTASLPDPNTPALQLTVLDVGQGTALVVSAGRHHLVFDTGPAFSPQFTAGEGIVLPYLRARGVRKLDALVISHWDKDHAGGYEALLAAMPAARVYWGEPARGQFEPRAQPGGEGLGQQGDDCHTAPPWRWGAVEFRFLQRAIGPNASANQRSCVLLVRYRDVSLLLPGDLDSAGEWALLRGAQLQPNLTLLVAAHHGSRSSSNPGFVAYTRPHWVVYSAGYRNPYHHPHPEVLARFAQQHSQAFNTAQDGAVIFRWHRDGSFEHYRARQQWRRYWYE